MFENRQLVLLSFVVALLTMLGAIIIPELYRVPYAFYNIVKLLAFSSLGYITYYLFVKKEIIPLFLTLVSGILYNPFSPIYLTRSIWMIVDILIVLILVYSFIKINKKNGSIDEKVEIDENCPISKELEKLIKYDNKISNRNTDYDEIVDNVKLIGISLGHFNEYLIKQLFNKNDIKYVNSTIANAIKQLSSHYDKNTINDLFYINQVRNKIVHSNDHIEFTEDSKDYFLADIKSAISKAKFLHKNLIK